METKLKRRILLPWCVCPCRFSLALLGLALITAYRFLQRNPDFAAAVCECFARPWHRAVARLCSVYPYSAAELVYVFGAAALLGYIISSVVKMCRKGKVGERLMRLAMTLLAAGLMFYGLACFLWGVYYSSADLPEALGVEPEPVSTEELFSVAMYFSERVNSYAQATERNENNEFSADKAALFDASAHLYDAVAVKYPSLSSPPLRAKPMLFSKFMSYINFTGFFFPFTGEASLNVDAPLCLLPSTIAHELAHQRGVAREDEANFAAVLSCMESSEADFQYSGALLALIHLGNALYEADPALYMQLRESYGEQVLADLRQNTRYWEQYETKAAEVSESVYEGVLQSYGEPRGMRSYGACVDLLVAWYKDAAMK